MTRYSLHIEGSTFVRFGFDDGIGVFLSVLDARLRGTNGETEEVVDVLKSIGEGDGSYSNVHTGRKGIGSTVGKKTMVRFLKGYDLPDIRILCGGT